MAKNPRGIGSIGDDLAKLIAKVIKNQAPAKVRAGISQAANKGVTSKPMSKLPTKPKSMPLAAKKAPKKTPTGRDVGKIASVTPPRPKRGVSLVDKSGVTNKPRSLPLTAAEQREADRRANQILKRTGDNPKPESRPKGNNKNVDVKGSIITPPSKATMRPAKPSKGSYEADTTRSTRKADAADIGRGQSRPKPKGEEAKMTSREREQARKNRETQRRESAKQGPSVQARMLRLEVHRAKTPAEKAVAQKNLTDFLLKKKK